jgi:hypothetical protein
LNTTPIAVSAYPLQWPLGIDRTLSHQRTKPAFKEKPWGRSLAALQREVKLLGGTGVTISTNQPLRNDGMPYANYRRIDDPGVSLWFILDGGQVCFPCDRYVTMGLNMRAIAMHLDAMRAMQRWGVGTARQQFAGYKALPSSITVVEAWWDVLRCSASATEDEIERRYKDQLRGAHPDTGGSDEAMARLNVARDAALEQVR